MKLHYFTTGISNPLVLIFAGERGYSYEDINVINVNVPWKHLFVVRKSDTVVVSRELKHIYQEIRKRYPYIVIHYI